MGQRAELLPLACRVTPVGQWLLYGQRGSQDAWETLWVQAKPSRHLGLCLGTAWWQKAEAAVAIEGCEFIGKEKGEVGQARSQALRQGAPSRRPGGSQ